ncbi:MAG: cupin domain-containing protein [Prochlorococcaceae cyanobacterium]
MKPEQLIRALELAPHPEGGHFRETYRAKAQVPTPRGPRATSTAILFLLAAGEASHWHRIHSDEAWHHHGGGRLLIYELSPAGSARRTGLGLDLAAGDRPQHVVPAGSWFAAEPAPASPWSLVSCTVAPGFDFHDFELARSQGLEPHGPALAPLCPHWRRLCRQA